MCACEKEKNDGSNWQNFIYSLSFIHYVVLPFIVALNVQQQPARQQQCVAWHLIHVTELSNNFPFNDYLIVIGTDRVAAFLQAMLTCKNQ